MQQIIVNSRSMFSHESRNILRKNSPVQVGANEVIACYLFTFVLVKHVQIILDALRDLSQFSQSKKRERHP